LLRVDTTNMADVVRTPEQTDQQGLLGLEASVKHGRTSEDLLFEVLLDCGLGLGLQITSEQVEGCGVLTVDDDALIACFADDVTDSVVRAIAARHPLRAVFRDAGFADDAARINTEQVFRQVFPETEVKAI